MTRTKQFHPDYRYTQNFVDAWSVDEVVALDVTRFSDDRPMRARPHFREVVERLADRCFVPLAVGGGVRTLDDVAFAISIGADKVILNSGAIACPELITETATKYGSQCVVVAIDAHFDGDEYQAKTNCGRAETGANVFEWARTAQAAGAGEILVTSIERDGSLSGYDLDLCRRVTDCVSVPVLICGGAGNWQHFVDGILIGGADAVCTTNIYHFTETSIRSAKAFLSKAGVPVRV